MTVVVTALTMAVLVMFAPSTVEAIDPSVGAIEAPWTAPIRRIDAALMANNPADAVRALHQAHLAALGSRRWDGMLAVGDAARRIGQSIGSPRVYDARARQAYLVGLFRARHDRSLDGVLRVADAFSSLGDSDVVEQCLHVARGLLARNPSAAAQARVLALEQRLADRTFASGPLRVEPF